MDPTSTVLSSLSPAARARAEWLVYLTRQAGYPVILTSGRRTAAEQRVLVAAGRSGTTRSRHLTGDAFDVDWHGWSRDDVPRQFWSVLGPWAERELGLVWGGRWQTPYDPGHFELPR